MSHSAHSTHHIHDVGRVVLDETCSRRTQRRTDDEFEPENTRNCVADSEAKQGVEHGYRGCCCSTERTLYEAANGGGAFEAEKKAPNKIEVCKICYVGIGFRVSPAQSLVWQSWTRTFSNSIFIERAFRCRAQCARCPHPGFAWPIPSTASCRQAAFPGWSKASSRSTVYEMGQHH